MCCLIPKNDRSTIALANIQTISLMQPPAALVRVTRAELRSTFRDLILVPRLREPLQAVASETSLRIFSAALRPNANPPDLSRSAAQTLRCLYRLVLKKRLRA